MERDDHQFGRRVTATALLGSVPVWAALLFTFLRDGEPRRYLVALALTLPIPLVLMVVRLRWTTYPSCGSRIRVPWNDPAYRRGGELTYNCPGCQTTWHTHLRPGSPTS